MEARRVNRPRVALTVWLWLGAAPLAAAPASCSKHAPPTEKPKGIIVDAAARTVAVPAEVARQETYKQLKGAIEYALVGKGGKVYETVFVTEHSAEEIQQALLAIGLRPGAPTDGQSPPRGMPLRLFVESPGGGKAARRPLEEFILRVRRSEDPPGETAEPLEPCDWPFAGSSLTRDPQTDQPALQASLTESIIGLHWSDRSPLLANPRPESRQENIYRANVSALPPAGAAVRIIFQRPGREVPAGTRRAHVTVSGRLQPAGFAAFTEAQARRLGLAGFVRNLADGRVEAVIEGPDPGVGELLEKMRRGPVAARVESLQAEDEPPAGDFRSFETW